MVSAITKRGRPNHPSARRTRTETKASRRNRSTCLCLESLEDRTLLSISLIGVPTWAGQGPDAAFGGDGAVGAVESMVVEPVPKSFYNPGGYVAYAGSVNGGIWLANNITDDMFDGKASPTTIQWVPISDFAPSLATSAIALDPLDPTGNTLWVATGSRSSWSGYGEGPAVGLLKTTDAGGHWTALGYASLNAANALSIYNLVPTSIFDSGTGAGRGGQVVVVATSAGVLVSDDGSDTFQSSLFGYATDIVVDPNDSQRLFAAMTNQGVFQGVYDSITGGFDWTAINGGNTTISSADDLKLAAYRGGPSTTLYVLTASNPFPQTLTAVLSAQVPTTGQPTWQQIGTAPAMQGDIYRANFGIVADPVNPNVVYVTGLVGTLYSANSQTDTWISIYGGANNTAPGVDSRHLMFLNSTTLVVTDDQGIYGRANPLSTSSSWLPLNASIADTEFFSIAYDPSNHVLFGGSQDNGSRLQSAADSNLWNDIAPLGYGDSGPVAVDPGGVHYFFGDQVFFRDGNRVQYAAPGGGPGSGLNPIDKANWYFANGNRNDASFPFVINPTDSSRLLFGMTGLYESLKPPAGQTYQPGDVINNVTPSGMTGNITAVAYGTNNPDAAYAATDTGQLWVRSGPGATFNPITLPGFIGGNVQAIVVDPFDWQTAYILDSANQVVMTTTAGGDWTDITTNLQRLATSLAGKSDFRTMMLADPNPSQAGQGVLLVGGFGGVYRLINPLGGTLPVWSRYGDPSGLETIPNVLVTGLEYDPTDDVLVAGTFGRGGFKVSGASQTLAVPEVLQINANMVRLSLDPNDPSILDVFLNNDSEPDFQVLLAQLQGIQVTGSGTNNSLTIDNTDGLITVRDLSFDGGSGNNSLIVNNSNDVSSENVYLHLGQLFGLGPGTIEYRNVVTIQATGGTGRNTFTVADPGFGIATTINTGDGDLDRVNLDGTYYGPLIVNLGAGRDFVDISPFSQNLSVISGDVTVHGSDSAMATLTVHDRNSLSTDEYTITAAGISGNADHGSINYNGIDHVVIEGSNAGGIFDVQDTSAAADTTIETGSGVNSVSVEQTNLASSLEVDGQGSDTVNVGAGGSVQQILGPVSVDTASAMVVDDSADPTPQTIIITPTTISGLAPATITCSDISALTVDGGYGGNLVGIHDTAAATNTTVNSGNGVDFVYVFATTGSLWVNTQQGGITPGFHGHEGVFVGGPVGSAGTLDTIQGALTINTVGRPNMDFATVALLDMATTTPETYTVTSDTVLRSGAAPIHYRVTNQLEFHLGSGGNLVNIQSTFPGLPDVFVGGLGNDTFNVGDSANMLNGIQSHLSFQIANPGSQVILHDEGNPASVNYTFSYDPAISPSHWVQRSNSGYYILYSGQLQSLVLDTGSGSHTINVQNTPAPTTVTIHSSGSDTVNIGNATDGVGDIQGPVSITNNSAAGDYTALIVDDSAFNRGYWFSTLSSGSLTTTLRTDSGNQVQVAPITFRPSDLRSLSILLGSSPGPNGNIITVADTPENTASGLMTTITTGTPSAGPGSDQVFVGATTGPLTVNLKGGYGQQGVSVGAFTRTLDPIKGAVTVNSPSGFGTNLAVFDDASTVAHHYIITNHTITGRAGLPVITYTLNNELTLSAGSGVNTVDVNSTSVATVVAAGQSGNDIVRVGDAGNTLNGITGGYFAVQIASPGSQVILNDQGDPNVRNYNFTMLPGNLPAITRTDAAGNFLTEMFFVGPLGNLTLNGSSSAGNDRFNLGVVFSNVAQVVLDGDSRTNTVRGPDVANTWQINGFNTGVLDKQVNFAGMQNLVGGAANDTFQFTAGGSIAGTVDGGTGTNTLDYGRDTGNVIVDLPLGLASLVNQMGANGIANIQNVTGSQGNDLLVGDANPNVLVGGNGRNVLIGGKGADTLDAHESFDDNILIGGTTDRDMNLAALEAIMAEWDRTDLNFNDRRSDLLSGTNGQGKTPLNMVKGQLILLTPATNPASSNGTVHADGAIDALIGTSSVNPATGKRAHNWFFYDALDVLMNFLSSSDRKNRVR